MSRLSKIVREYVKCPQLDGGTEYGEWGALRLDQRKQIAKLCEEVDVFEDAADKFGKVNYILKQQLEDLQKDYDDLMLTSVDHESYYETINDLNQQLAEKEKEIEHLKDDIDWYSFWHNKFQREIEDLKTELETYRPTHLKGDGQCQCAICKQINWTDWCIEYDGKIYCNECFKQVETRDDKLRHQICEKIKRTLYDNWRDMKLWWLSNGKCIELEELLDQIEKGE